MRWQWAVVVTLVACSGDVAGPSSAPLDVDVVINGERVQVFPREQERPCTCVQYEWPKPGSCVPTSEEVSCTCEPGPAACLTSIRVEQAGAVVTEAAWDPRLGAAELVVAGMSDTSAHELVLQGCGGLARIPLRPESRDGASLTRLSIDGDALRIDWASSETGTAAVATCANEYGGAACRLPFEGPARLSVDACAYAFVSVETVAGGSEETSDLGVTRVWNGAITTGADRVFIPQALPSNRWTLPTSSPWPTDANAALGIDGMESTDSLIVEDASFGLDGSLMVAGQTTWFDGSAALPVAIEFVADAGTDSLVIDLDGEVYRGEFPYVSPIDPLELGGPGIERYEVGVGPVSLAADGAGGTRDVTLHLVWAMGIVADPR